MSDEIIERLDYLRDLFVRRLDERKEHSERLRQAEGGLFRDLQMPLVNGIATVIDRLDAYGGEDPAFAAEIRDELLELLNLHGIHEVPTDDGFDKSLHAAQAVHQDAEGEPGKILEVWNRGYMRDAYVFRPARVVVSK